MSGPEYKVYFTTRAFTQLVCEIEDHPNLETGGIFIGRRINNTFYVFETIDPGLQVIREPGMFEIVSNEYSERLAYVISNLYEGDTSVIGFFHKHPPTLDRFSGGDRESNMACAQKCNGAISGLVNVDGEFKLQIWYVAPPDAKLFKCSSIEVNDSVFDGVMKLRDYHSVLQKITEQELPASFYEPRKGGRYACPRKERVGDVFFSSSNPLLAKLKQGFNGLIGTDAVSTLETSDSILDETEEKPEDVCQRTFHELENELHEISTFARVTLRALSDTSCIVRVDRGAVIGEFVFLFSWNEEGSLVLTQIDDGVESASPYTSGTILELVKANIIS